MVRIRLSRVGGRGQASYRLVAIDRESPRDGRSLEILGFYNPRTQPATFKVKEDRIYDWMSKGAQPSESVTKLFESAGVLTRFARYKAGETVEALVAEAEAAQAGQVINPKTRRETPAKAKKAKEAKEQKETEEKKEE
jgi:small subunit ribosomal protein S16